MLIKAAAVALAAILTSGAAHAASQADAFATTRAETKKSGNKLGPVLNALYKGQVGSPASTERNSAVAPKLNRLKRLLRATDGRVMIDIAVSASAAAARPALEAAGLTEVSVYQNRVSGRIRIDALQSIAKNADVLTVRPVLASTRAGLTVTQGDRAQRTNVVRKNLGLTGAGVKIGVLSDSYNCLRTPLSPDPLATFTTAEQDIANGDLPRVQVLKEMPEPDCSAIGTDEGRAILQLLHDVAPASKLAYYTAFVSQADMATGIEALADAGAQVIIDDVIHYDEPMFQDGIIAQAIDAVKARGVTYFSSAGNEQRQSYEAAFRRSREIGAADGVRHNFGTHRSPDTLQSVTLDPEGLTLLSFQWDEPLASVSGNGGSRSDLDLVFYDLQGQTIPLCDDNLEPTVCQFPGIEANVNGDPIELAVLSNATDSTLDAQLDIELYAGPPPGRMKYVWFDLRDGLFHVNELDTQSSTAYGHANAAGAEAVGAAAWYNTAEYGSPLWGNRCKPACAEIFSSAGGVPILFDTRGRRFAVPRVRSKPGITGPDGGNTSFFFSRYTDPPVANEPDQFPNFFGTSASAPHVAGIAALMIEQMMRNRGGAHVPRRLRPDFIITTLRATSDDMKYRAGRITPPSPVDHPNRFDFDTGYGFVDAVKALTAVKVLRVTTD